MRRYLRGTGWTFIGMGCFVLYFLAYQLVGTDAETSRDQANLRRTLEREWAAPSVTPKGKASRPAPEKPPGLGKPIGLLDIPKIRLHNLVIVQGAGQAQLAQGPGHVPETGMPGQTGTFGVSGHRVTHSHPFYNLNELAKGDTITVVTKNYIYTYAVTHTAVVSPHDTQVLDNANGPDGRPKAQIVLTTCNPRYSASTRLVVFGDLAYSSPNAGGPIT